jgi:hypothetical protein
VTAFRPAQQKPVLSYIKVDLIKNAQNKHCFHNLPGKSTIDELFNYFGLFSNPPRTFEKKVFGFFNKKN